MAVPSIATQRGRAHKRERSHFGANFRGARGRRRSAPARVTPSPLPRGARAPAPPPSRRAFLDPEPGGMSALKEAATRTTRSARVRKQAMELTEAAAARIKDLLTSKQKPYLKIGVRTRGCNGMTYTMKYADDADKGKFDEVVTHENSGVKVIIDPAALMHIIGTKMDFVQDRIRSEFVFENPNAKGECGCGESFNV